MSAPLPPSPVSPRTVAACLALASLVAVVALAVVGWLGTRPLAEPSRTPVTFAPLPASTAGPAPHTVELTAIPLHQRGPR